MSKSNPHVPRSTLRYWPFIPHKTGIRVYCYHGVVESKSHTLIERNMHLLSDFRDHLRFLRHFRVLSLDELKAEIPNPAPKIPTAVITFDDGYANNLLACEVLQEFDLPASFFLSTGAIGRAKAIWTVELSLLLLHGEAKTVEALGQRWSLALKDERETAFQAIRLPMKKMPAPQRADVMETIRGQFPAGETARLLEVFPSLQMMNWAEVQQLAGAGMTIGSHGVHHEIHHAVQLDTVCRSELHESKAEIETLSGRSCDYFAFPNGDYSDRSAQEVASAGYSLGFTMRTGLITSASNPFLLPRFNPAGAISRFRRAFYLPKT